MRLRNALAADQAADAAGRLNEMLPPQARAALEGVVAIGGPWLQDHPGYRELVEALKQHVSDQAETAEAEASAEIIDALEPPAVAENIDPATLAVGQAARDAAFDPGPVGRREMSKKVLLDYTRGFVIFLLRTPFKALKWGDGAFTWTATRVGGAYVCAKVLVALEPTLKIYISQHMPGALFYFEKLMEAVRVLPWV